MTTVWFGGKKLRISCSNGPAFSGSSEGKRTSVILKSSEDDVVLINIHCGLGLRGRTPTTSLLAFGVRKGHSEIELFEILPVIHLWLVINETSWSVVFGRGQPGSDVAGPLG